MKKYSVSTFTTTLSLVIILIVYYYPTNDWVSGPLLILYILGPLFSVQIVTLLLYYRDKRVLYLKINFITGLLILLLFLFYMYSHY